MKVAIFQFKLFGINTYIVYDPESGEGAIIDPGMSDAGEVDAIEKFLKDNNITLKYIINTHLHIDHAAGNKAILDKYSLPVVAHPEEEILGKAMKTQAGAFGLREIFDDVEISKPVHPGDVIHIGSGELEVIDVAGHSPGGIALYDKKDGFVIVGDALFQGSIGRTDLFGGDVNKLLDNIHKNLFTLPDHTVVFPGHGPSTTIGEEKRMNPFFR